MNTEYTLTKKEKEILLQSEVIRGLAVSGVDTPEKYEITMRILDGSSFREGTKFTKEDLEIQFDFYNGKYPYGLVFDDGSKTFYYWYWSNRSAKPYNCKQLTFDELFEKYVASKRTNLKEKVKYEEVRMFRSNLTGKLYECISDLEKGDYEYMKDDIEQHFFEEDYNSKMSINLEDLVDLNKQYGVKKVQEIIEELS